MTKVQNVLFLIMLCLTMSVLSIKKARKLRSRSLIQYTLRADAAAYHSLPASSERSGCFIDTVDKLLSTYEKRIITYEAICQSLGDHGDIQIYLKKAVDLGHLQSKLFKDKNYTLTPADLALIQGLGFTSITYKDDVLTPLTKLFNHDAGITANKAIFLIEKATTLIELKYSEAYLKASYTATTECITVEKKILDIVELLYTDLNEEYSEISPKPLVDNLLYINPKGFNYGGYALAFWIKEDNADILEPVRIFNAFAADELSISLTMDFGIQYQFFDGTEEAFIQSNGECTQFTFVFLSIDKNCDDFHLTLVLRQSHSNARFIREFDVPKEFIEFLEIQLDNHFLHAMGYSHIKYSLEEEVRIFGKGLADVKNSIIDVNEKCDDNQGDLCIYYSVNHMECQACKEGAFMFEKECVEKCPDFTFPDDKFVCEKCTEHCIDCLDQTHCSKCDDKTYLLNGKCVNNCPSNMFPTSDRECKECDDSGKCSICESSEDCAECMPPKKLAHGDCVDTCPPKTYYSSLDNKCHDCPTTCAECNSATECTKCIPEFFLTEDKKCVEYCDAGYFPNKDSKQCDQCIVHCKTCENPNECQVCKEGYKLLEDKTCEIICQPGQVPINNVCFACTDKNCNECSDANINICEDCKDGFVLKDGQCLFECGDQYYPDKHEVCQPCKDGCQICQDPSTCDQCLPPKYLVDKKDCLLSCPDGYVPSGKECKKCEDEKCKHCNKEDDSCTACYPPMVLQNGECEEDCSPNYVLVGQECKKCPAGCAECSDPFTCDVCEEGLVLDNVICLTECPEGKRKNQAGMCEECFVDDCKKCDAEVTICDECVGKKLLYNNHCWETCPEGTFMKEGSIRCETCSTHCAQCVDKEICINCDLGFVLQDNKCESQCKDGYYQFAQTCLPCDDTECKKCDKLKDQCTACYDGKLLQDGECVTTCDDGKFPKDGHCKDCLTPCETCISETECNTCEEGFVMEDGKKTCTNECTDGKIIVDEVCKECTDSKCKVCLPDLDCCVAPKGPDDVIEDCKIVDECSPGHYLDGFICKPCKDNCAKCSNGETCDLCQPGYNLKGKDCVIDCGDNFVAVDQVCKQCDENCKQCLPTDITHCTECYFKFLWMGKCETVCPSGTWADGDKCVPCSDPLCKTCSNEGKTCDECKVNTAFYIEKCIHEPCPPGYVADKGVCVPCSVAHCENCQERKEQCEECKDGFFLVNAYQCNDQCPSGTHSVPIKENPLKFECEDCQINCAKCNDEECLKCVENKVLQDGQCITTCHPGYFNNNGICQECSVDNCEKCTKDKCLQCEKDFVLDPKLNTCPEKCPSGTFPNIDKTCIECPITCSECINESQCTDCKDNLKLQDGKCLDECSEGQVANDNNECVMCQIPTGCIKCDKDHLQTCTECRPPLHLEENKCVETCSEGHYPEGKKCEKCIDNCKICFNANECIECNPGKVLFENKCINQCPQGFFDNGGKCEECTTGCLSCTKTECLICNKDMLLEEGKCVTDCSPQYYKKNEKECAPCSDNCLVCLGPKDCTTCAPGLVIGTDGFCHEKCKEQEIPINSKCTTCSDKNCDQCSGSPDNCIDCNDETTLNNGKCLTECPPGSFEENNKCVPCIKNCAICKDKDTCEKCVDPFNYDTIETQCADGRCPNEGSIIHKCDICRPGYSPFNGVCTKCEDKNCKECVNTSDKCSKCDDNYVLYNAECYDKCPKETFMPVNSVECKDCPQPCASCTNADTCQTCDEGFHLENKKCVSECASGSVSVNGVCEKCETTDCQICKEDKKECTKCDEGLFLLNIAGNTTCVTDCGDHYYDKNGKCIHCSETECLTCKNDICTECPLELTLQGVKCQEVCDVGYTERNNVCEKCDDPNCAVCNPLDTSKCDKCILNFVLKNNKCEETCEPYYYTKDFITHLECAKCGDNCEKCTNEKNCEKCKPNFVIKEGICVENCGPHWVLNNGICHKCTQPDCIECFPNDLEHCKKCSNNLVIDQNGKCVVTCGPGMTVVSGHCVDCPENCTACKPSGVCTECKTGMFLQKGQCVFKCDSNYTPNDAKECIQCEDKLCETCDLTNQDCTSCPKGSVLHNGECLTTCPEEFYPDNGACKPCISNCKICHDNKECKECKDDFSVQNGQCTDKCDEFYVDIDGTCEKCDDEINCIQCATDKSTCFACATGSYLFEGKCVITCPPKTYPSNNQCLPCGIHCLNCLSATICTKCEEPFNLHKNECLADCPANTGEVNDKCEPCKELTCEKCKSDLETCEKCSGKLIVDDGKCITACSPGFYHDATLQKCLPCIEGCVVCLNNVSCKQCKDNLILTNQGLCDIECKDGQYKKPNAIQCLDCTNKNCKKCDPLNPDSCTECPAGEYKIIINGKTDCTKTCPDGTYVHNGTCTHCKAPCQTCTSETHCLTCIPPQIHNESDDGCTSACKDGYVEREGHCLKCTVEDCKLCDPMNTNICTICMGDLILFRNECFEECPKGYYHNTASGLCEPCSTTCTECDKLEECITCAPGHNMMENTKECVVCSPPNTIVDDMCVGCKVSECFQCSKENPNICDSCKPPHVLHEGNCLPMCPEGFSNVDNVCVKCEENCAACTSTTDCIKCDIGYVLAFGDCMTDCPSGYRNNTEGICEKCNIKDCAQCPESVDICEKCEDKLLYENECRNDCPLGTMISNDECIECQKDCNVCDKNGCLVCKEGMMIKNGECVNECGPGFYQFDLGCLPCKDDLCDKCTAHKCEECKDGAFLQPEEYKECGKTCPLGYLMDNETGKCEKCDMGCASCTEEKCEECIPPFAMFNGTCLQECPPKHIPKNGECVPCTQDSCNECTHEHPEVCKKCEGDLVLHKGECLEKCPDETFELEGKCPPCEPNCDKCKDEKQCTQCKPGQLLENGDCVNTCGDGYVKYLNTCIPCAEEPCLQCSEDTKTCFKCEPPTYLLNGKCINTCPRGSYPDILTNRCLPCDTSCDVCLSAQSCEKCAPGYYMNLKGECVAHCEEGTYEDCGEDVRKCKLCNPACKTCISSTNSDCLACNENYILFDHKCIDNNSCPEGTFFNKDTCTDCEVDHCKFCSDANTCTVCDRGFTLTDAKGCTFANKITPVIKDYLQVTPQTFNDLEKRQHEIFPVSALKGTGVGSATFSFSFYLRTLSPQMDTDTTVLTIFNEHKDVYIYRFIITTDDLCVIKAFDKDTVVSTTIVGECAYSDIYDWKYFSITINKGSTNFKVHTNQLKGSVVSSRDNMFPLNGRSGIVIDTSKIILNENTQGAFNIGKLNIMDYSPSEEQIVSLAKYTPSNCDYFCTDCQSTCLACPNKFNPIEGRCQAQFVSFVDRPLLIPEGKPSIIKYSDLSRVLTNDKYGITVWALVTKIDDDEKHYITKVKLDKSSMEASYVDIFVYKGKLHIGHLATQAIQQPLEVNKWYFIVVTYTHNEIKVTIRDQADYKHTQVIKDLFSRNYNSMIHNVGQNYFGSIYNFKSYINNLPTEEDIAKDYDSIKCPVECEACGADLKCTKCKTDLVLVNGVCTENIAQENHFTPLANMINIWSLDEKNYVLTENTPFTISLSMRKKTHSYPYEQVVNANLISLQVNDQKVPLIQQTILSNYTIALKDTEAGEFVKDYDSTSFDFFNVIIIYKAATKEVSVRFLDHSQGSQFLSTLILNGAPTQLILGDINGYEINMEYTNINFYPGIADKNLLNKLQTYYFPNEGICTKYNFATKKCKTCLNVPQEPETDCNCAEFGISNSYLWGEKDYDAITVDPKYFKNIISSVLPVNINSDAYAVLASFKLLKVENGMYRIGCFSNDHLRKFTFEKSRGHHIICLDALSNNEGQITLLINVNDNNGERIKVKVPNATFKAGHIIRGVMAIDVATKKLSYGFVVDQNSTVKYVGTYAFTTMPERLQNSGGVTLFAIGETVDKQTHKVPAAYVYDFVIMTSFTFSESAFDHVLDKIIPMPNDPYCGTDCLVCVSDNGQPKCLESKIPTGCIGDRCKEQ